MSYDVSLELNGQPVKVERHTHGAIYAIFGTVEADMSVTYNYSKFFQELSLGKGLRWLNGKTGGMTINRLLTAYLRLGTNTTPNYWDSAPGNAGAALKILYDWAVQHPLATWRVT